MRQLTDGWLGAPCQELFAYIQEACFLVISTSTPTEYLLQLCEGRDITFRELLGEMQQVEFSFLGANQRQPGRQFVLIRHKHVDPSVLSIIVWSIICPACQQGASSTYLSPHHKHGLHICSSSRLRLLIQTLQQDTQQLQALLPKHSCWVLQHLLQSLCRNASSSSRSSRMLQRPSLQRPSLRRLRPRPCQINTAALKPPAPQHQSRAGPTAASESPLPQSFLVCCAINSCWYLASV